MDFKLRPWAMSDKNSLALYANNFKIAKFMTNAFPHPYTIENAEEFIKFATKDGPAHIFAIDIDGEAVGGIGLHLQPNIKKMLNSAIGSGSHSGEKVLLQMP